MVKRSVTWRMTARVGHTPLLLNAEAETLCSGVEAVGQLENTVNEGACTSRNASFLLWLLILSNSLEGCHANCRD
jgi:hypothetical protein